MEVATKISRILLGLILLIQGANGFLNFLPYPELNPEAGAFMGAIASTKIIFPLLGIIEVVFGILLMAKKAVPLTLIVVFPILVNAMIFHVSLDPQNMLFAAICFILNLFLIYHYWDNYKALCK
ncbi:MAG: hypothetical protein ACPGC8_05965 [Flavobacteriaceae bacterium]